MSESQDQDRPVDDAGGVLSDPLGLIGKVVAKKYVIESYIGCGGFGEVYKGINVHLQKQRVVLKFFTNTRLSDKFEREARILSLLNHPSICGIHDYLPEQKAIVIPFIDGRDLGEILIETKQLPEEIFLRIAHAVTEALIAAHNEKIAHRDIKPSNIMIDKNNNVYLIDFGIAKEMTEPATWTKYNVLTPQFAAPERHGGGKEYNPFLSDIYELGVTLFYLATRMMPYRTPDNPQLDEWDDPHTRILAKPLKQILQKAAAPHPEDRYQTVHEMAADLRRIIHIYRRRRRLWIPATAASVIVLAGVAAYLWLAGCRMRIMSTRAKRANAKP